MSVTSAGLLMYRRAKDAVEVLIAHPGGPYWAKKDDGAWSIPKGLADGDEDLFTAAVREFVEETGVQPEPPFVDLGQVKNPSGKIIFAWGFEGTCDTKQIKSNLFSMEWPPKSGQMKEFPEIDRAEFFTLRDARKKLHAAQTVFLDQLKLVLGLDDSAEGPRDSLF